ncbi:hypothetical protein TVAG_230210 [Trichomonas vaginalis G3]|uniref:Secretory carrier membrane protein n=1 Tax=Trichomonas vaginalis (strain ATCC PRA-98 / G3) TaxID=412133 RepID=A2F109_TRIV3|nr:protein transport [Trichomonas vaginalis G3]EAY01417.1 hypothetical protein TVAG_230210 [Trichomonas vaginalis G3]KAI5529513.1 protein transport [Trichomonas vaginalis G3]|eukprot:XP_001330252.1 hypothetical protein [Trichomonas vaginalis G3]
MTNPFETIDDDYNPFVNDNAPATTPVSTPAPAPAQAPPPQQPTYTPPKTETSDSKPQKSSKKEPSFIPFPGSVMKDSATGFSLSEKDLDERERALAEKEQKIAQREREIEEAKANGTYNHLNPHKRNFPIILNWYKYYPDEDIPKDAQQLVKFNMWTQYLGAILLALNFLGCLFLLAAGEKVKSPSASILFSAIYLIIMVPICLDIIFMVLYNSLKEQKGLKFIGYLIGFGVYLIFIAFLAIGAFEYGSVGWVISINVLTGETGKWVGGYGIVWSIAATAFVVICGWLWYKAYKYYKSGSLSTKAFTEAAALATDYAREHPEQVASAVSTTSNNTD